MKKRGVSILLGCVFAVIIALTATVCSPNIAEATAGTDYSSYTTINNFVINTQADFDSFASKYNANSAYNFYGKTITLNCDIDLADLTMRFSVFQGTFEGNGHKIYNQTKPLFSSIGTKTIFPQIKSLDFVNAQNLEDFAFADINYGTLTDINYWGNFAPIALNFKGLVKNNFGTMQNCTNFATIKVNKSAKLSGITENNYGTLESCHFMGEIIYDLYFDSNCQIALIAYNNYIENNTIFPAEPSAGLINNCTSFANLYFNEITIPNNVPQVRLLFGNRGTVSNSSIVASINNLQTTTLELGFVELPYGGSSVINSYYAYSDTFGVYDGSGTLSDFSSGWETYFVAANLGAQFYFYDNSYPVNNTIYPSDGASGLSVLTLANTSDIYKLRAFYGSDDIYAKMDFDCNFSKLPTIKRLIGSLSNINFDGQNYTFYLASKPFIFDSTFIIDCQFLGCLATNAVLKISENADDNASIYYDNSAFNYGYSGGACVDIVPALTIEGTGTRSDPYLIASAEELAYLEDLNGYALLTADIVINNTNNTDNKLPLNNLRVTLFGGGHSIIGIVNQNFAVNNYGTITDIFFRGYINSAVSSLVCENNYGEINNAKISATINTNNGSLVASNNINTIASVSTFGTVSGENTCGIATQNGGIITKSTNYASITAINNNASGIAYENTGSITLSSNYGSANYGTTANQQGTITNTINMAVGSFAGSNTGVSTSINKSASYFSLINNGTLNNYLKLDYLTMKENASFNMATVFGYEVNTSYDYPVLRERGKKYKTALASPFKTYPFGNITYNGDSYLVEEIQLYVVSAPSSSATFTWLYNGNAFYDDYLMNAGTYTMTAIYLGNGTTLPAKAVQNLVIKKAVPPVSLEYESFNDISKTYKGEYFVIDTPDPTNIIDIASYGYTLSNVFTKNGTTITQEDILLPAIYKQTIVFSNVNYFDLTISRNITVAKANVNLTIGDATISYLQNITWSNVTAALSGLVAVDSGKTIDILIPDYNDYFTTNYTVGSGIGQYYLSFSLTAIECYTITVDAGTLTVSAIDLLQGGISFYNATKGTNGSSESFYNGQYQSLSASNLGEGVSVLYQNNENKNAGTYFPKAIFSKENYNDLELTVYFVIKKIPLTVTVVNQTKNYGYALDIGDFTSTLDGLNENDTKQSVFVERAFSYSVYDGVTLKQPSDILDAGIYSIELTIGGNDTTNYNVSIIFGTLSINKVDLKYLYDNNGVEESTFDDHTYVYSGLQFAREITYFANNSIDVSIVYNYYLNDILLPNSYAIGASTYVITATVTPQGSTATNFVTTTYTCIMIIDKKPLSFAFTESEYTFIYAKEAYGISENFGYEGFLPQGVVPTFACKKDGIASSGTNAGNYVLTYSVAESDNYYGHVATATLVVLPKEVSVLITDNYTFTAKAITLEATINGAINEEITYANLAFTYKNASENTVSAITAVGSYSVTVSIVGCDNYTLATSVFPVSVSPYNIYFEWGTLAYVYGTVGEFTYLDKNYLIAATKVTYRNYFIADLNTSIDIGLNFSSDISGLYYLEESQIIKPANYNIYFTTSSKTNNLNIINISKRPLSVVWKIDNIDHYTQSYSGSYTGVSQSNRWSYSLSNFAFSDSVNDISIQKQVLGDANDIFHVGDYTIMLTILNNLNYVLTNNFINVEVVKAVLKISINDDTIEYGETYYYPNITASGARGSDDSKPVNSLDSANIRMVTSYVTTSPVGSMHNINVVATFRNYTAEIIKTGTLTVVANDYPDYNLVDAAYVYDGTNKTATIAGVIAGVSVSYSNNVHKNAGAYTASAVITYPSGRVKVSTCIITIIKATPILTLNPSSFVYTDNRLLLAGDIKGKAMYKGTLVQGSFQFVGEWYLRLGEYKSYEISFTPDDTQNYNAVNSLYTVSSVEIDYSVLVFDNPLNFTFTSESTAEITAQVVITLKNIIDGLSLYSDGSKVDGIVLNKTEAITLQVRYNGEIVFQQQWDVTLIDTSSPSNIEVNEKMLELSGVSFSDGTLNVNALGGRIRLSEQYKDSYAMYVNGILLDEYIVNGNEESLIIIIKSKTIANLTLFAKEYTIETVIIEEPPIKRDYSVYFITIGSVLGVALLIGLIIVIRKRKQSN